MSKGQRTTVCLSRAFVTSPRRGIIYERKITICRSLFRSERCFLVQYIRGEILAWIVCFNYYEISRTYFRQISIDRVHPVLGPRLRLFVKNFYMKLKCDFKKFLLKKLMECPVTALIESRLISRRRFSQRACR